MSEYIERSALLQSLKSSGVASDFALYKISNFPAADVAPVVHGHWLAWEEQFPDNKPPRKNNLGVFCSACHNHADNINAYCPNCGAKMDGGD